MRIKLIAPARKSDWPETFWDLRALVRFVGRKAAQPPSALALLAAHTPPDVAVTITDEAVEPIDFEEKVDLVGITGMTCLIPRGYEIADEYRKRGIRTVMGGMHVSMLPDEAVQHCDAVVIGEAEAIWPEVVRDAERGALKKFYRASGFPDLTHLPIPRWDLVKSSHYFYFPVQTGRGCPNDCNFCSVTALNGRRYRPRRVEDVILEIEMLQSLDRTKPLFITDDNLLTVRKYATGLLRAMAPLGLTSWWCQASLNRLDDDALLALLREAGCRMIFVGFESVSQESLSAMSKCRVNEVAQYKEIIDKIHAHGMGVFGSFILGSDADDPTIFDKTIQFIEETNIVFSMINILTPCPGTRLHRDLARKGRLLHRNWELYDGENVCYNPAALSKEELESGRRQVLQQIYDYPSLYRRLRNNSFHPYIRTGNEGPRRLNKERLASSLDNPSCRDDRRRHFVIQSLGDGNEIPLWAIVYSLTCHDYAYGQT